MYMRKINGLSYINKHIFEIVVHMKFYKPRNNIERNVHRNLQRIQEILIRNTPYILVLKDKKETQSTRKGYKKDVPYLPLDVNNYVAKRDPVILILSFFFM